MHIQTYSESFRHILVCIFAHFVPYLVNLEIYLKCIILWNQYLLRNCDVYFPVVHMIFMWCVEYFRNIGSGPAGATSTEMAGITDTTNAESNVHA